MTDPLDALRARLESRLGHLPDGPARIARRDLPFGAWLLERATRGDARVIAVNGPQGAGKSTLCATAVDALGAAGLRAVCVSIDDFYLPHEGQRALSAAHPGDPYLEFRGYPGTHDVALGCAVIDALRADDGGGVAVPVYDKSAHGGRGDRAAEALWRREVGPFDLVLVEGWMLGFAPVPEGALADPRMSAANALLAGYAGWNARCDALAQLVMADPADVVRWRVDAERARREAGADALSDEAARDYVLRFVPAYATWVAPMRAAPAIRGPRWERVIGADRLPLG